VVRKAFIEVATGPETYGIFSYLFFRILRCVGFSKNVSRLTHCS